MPPPKKFVLLKVKPKQAILKSERVPSEGKAARKWLAASRKVQRAMARSRHHHLGASQKHGLEHELWDDPGAAGACIGPKTSSLAWMRAPGSCIKVLAAGTLYLLQVLTEIVRHWDWEDHARVVRKFGMGAATGPRQALLMLQAGRVGPRTMQRLIHRKQLFATRAVTASENMAGLAATCAAEQKVREDAGWQYLARVRLESQVCRQELVPAVVQGALRRVRLGELIDVMWSDDEAWEVFL
jgi:hypothetical protein